MLKFSRFSSAVTATLVGSLIALAVPAVAGAQGSATGQGSWPWPALGAVITPYVNGQDRYAAGQHRGIDIAAAVGTSVSSIVAGRVSFSGRLPDGGQAVTVTSDDGRWLVSSLHLSRRTVARGADVAAGESLGRVGTSGRRSAEQPHLHLGVRHAGSRDYVDPMSLLGAPRLAEPPAAAVLPRIRTLERPARRSPDVHAQRQGDTPPATRHGDGAQRPAAARPAGAHAREGRAASSTGRAAPPPLPAVSSAAPQPAGVKQTVSPASSQPTASAARRGVDRSPHRLLLLAIAAVCLVALWLRRRASGAATKPAPEPVSAARKQPVAKILEFERINRSA